jgi:cell division protein FtsW (lipid II flippase)
MDKRSVSSGFSGIVFPLVLTLLPMVLIIKQPDLGTGLILLPIFFAIMFVDGTRIKYIFTLIDFGLA